MRLWRWLFGGAETRDAGEYEMYTIVEVPSDAFEVARELGEPTVALELFAGERDEFTLLVTNQAEAGRSPVGAAFAVDSLRVRLLTQSSTERGPCWYRMASHDSVRFHFRHLNTTRDLPRPDADGRIDLGAPYVMPADTTFSLVAEVDAEEWMPQDIRLEVSLRGQLTYTWRTPSLPRRVWARVAWRLSLLRPPALPVKSRAREVT